MNIPENSNDKAKVTEKSSSDRLKVNWEELFLTFYLLGVTLESTQFEKPTEFKQNLWGHKQKHKNGCNSVIFTDVELKFGLFVAECHLN